MSDGTVFGAVILIAVVLFLALFGTLYLLMKSGVGVTYMPEQTQGIIIEKAIFGNRGSLSSGPGRDNYQFKLQRIEEEGWVEFWVVLGDTEYAAQMWNTVNVGDFCIQGEGYKRSRSRWTCEEATS